MTRLHKKRDIASVLRTYVQPEFLSRVKAILRERQAAVAEAAIAVAAPAQLDIRSAHSVSIEARIAELIADASAGDEPVSKASLADLMEFLGETPFTKRPGIFLLDNGNFRAVWKNADNEQAAFQFRGDAVVHCVFFYKRDSDKLPLNQETLVDLMPNLREKYPIFQRLLNGERS